MRGAEGGVNAVSQSFAVAVRAKRRMCGCGCVCDGSIKHFIGFYKTMASSAKAVWEEGGGSGK